MGQVLQAGAGQIPARQAAVKAGIPMIVPALTINKVCLSGLDAIALADQLIRAGEFDIIVAGGQESMTNAPHLLPRSRAGLQVRRDRAARRHGLRRPHRRLRPHPDGRVDRAPQRQARPHPRGAGRVRRPLAPARGARGQERRVRRGDHPGLDPAAQGRPDRVPRRRGHPRRHHRRVAGQAAARLHQGRHHHRRLGLADLRRRRRGGRHEQGQGRGARPDAGSPRSAPTATSPARTTRCSRSRPTRSSTRWARRACRSATSTSSRSTRRSPPSACSR